MISFGYDYHWSDHNAYVDHEVYLLHKISRLMGNYNKFIFDSSSSRGCRNTLNSARIVLQEEHATECYRQVNNFFCTIVSISILNNFWYLFWQERSVGSEKFSYTLYLCYLLYAPLYIAGPIISFNAFASQVLWNPSILNFTIYLLWHITYSCNNLLLGHRIVYSI